MADLSWIGFLRSLLAVDILGFWHKHADMYDMSIPFVCLFFCFLSLRFVI